MSILINIVINQTAKLEFQPQKSIYLYDISTVCIWEIRKI